MRRKNTMKLWQMITLAVLLFAVVMSMFLPIVSLKGSRVVNMALDVVEELADEKFEISDYEKFTGFNLDDIDKFDEQMKRAEKKSGINLSALSGIEFIMMDTNAFLLGTKDYTRGDVEEKIEGSERASELKKAVTIYKVVFAVVYFGAIVILFLVLLGFFVKWSKYTMAIVSSAFGLVTTVVFALYRWGVPPAVLSYNDIDDKNVELIAKMFWKAVVGMGVMTCLILGILIFVMGILTCIIGKASVQPQPVIGSGFDSGWGAGQSGFGSDSFGMGGFGQGGFGQGGGGPVFPLVDNTVKRDPDPVIKPEPPKPAKPKCGRVKCTQGAAMGQGFKLPEDRKVIVGKSPQNATLVIHDQHVSNVHCSIRYRQETDSYIVKDHSTNGTFVQGVRLAKEVAMEYPAGTVLSLADGTNKITLG